MVPVVGPIAADILDPLVRLFVEAGYDRTISPGQPTRADFGYFPNPIAFVGSLPVAVLTGLDNGLEDIGLDRVMQTARPEVGPNTTGQGAYGIGGPPVTMNPTTNDQSMMLSAPAVANDVNSGVAEANTSPLSDRPKFNVLRMPLMATPGQSGTGTTKVSGPKLSNPAGAVLTGVRETIKGVRDTIKGVRDSLKGANDSEGAADGAASADAA
jgi:hypothetical protein